MTAQKQFTNVLYHSQEAFMSLLQSYCENAVYELSCALRKGRIKLGLIWKNHWYFWKDGLDVLNKFINVGVGNVGF